ncbi:hypothetical protein F5B21DRAFT_487040 [Xylaria acuta]|nr:hypothetical protein F5B21DRAFT_487040 [Xylaria acuta]
MFDHAAAVVKTNNFRQVLLSFNEHGHLANAATRVSITCQICADKQLAITNPDEDKVTANSHKSYCVIPAWYASAPFCYRRPTPLEHRIEKQRSR